VEFVNLLLNITTDKINFAVSRILPDAPYWAKTKFLI